MASKRSLGSLLVQVGADTKQLNSALGDAEAKVKGFGSRVKREATGTRASFSGMGNSASAALSRMGALGGGLVSLGGVGGIGAAVGGAAFGASRLFAAQASRSHAFSPESVRLSAELGSRGVMLDKKFAETYPLLTALLNNKSELTRQGFTALAVDPVGFAGNLSRIDEPLGLPDGGFLTILGTVLGGPVTQLVGLVQFIAGQMSSNGNETPFRAPETGPLNSDNPGSGPPMDARGPLRGLGR